MKREERRPLAVRGHLDARLLQRTGGRNSLPGMGNVRQEMDKPDPSAPLLQAASETTLPPSKTPSTPPVSAQVSNPAAAAAAAFTPLQGGGSRRRGAIDAPAEDAFALMDVAVRAIVQT